MKHYLAIIGYGAMGPLHRKIIKYGVSEIEVVGVYDIRSECMEKAAAQGLKTYSSLDELLFDERIDIVTIATPNDTHKNLAIRCLRAGKNVVCEKPVTLTSADLVEVMEVAKECGKIFTIHQNRRWDKDYRQIKKIIADNTLGKPYFLESRVTNMSRCMNGWRGYKCNGGGLLLDWGIHLLDQLLDLFDSPVVSVDAHILSLYSPETDDSVRIFLRYENGVSVLFEVGYNCFIPLPRWHMCCEHGTVAIAEIDGKGTMRLADSTGEVRHLSNLVYTADGIKTDEIDVPMNNSFVELDMPVVESEWCHLYRNVAAAIDGREELIVKPEQALRVLKVVELAHQSNKIHTAIACRI